MFGRFLFSVDVNTIYGIQIQLIMLIIPNTIENESKNRVQINKMTMGRKCKTQKRNLKCKYLLIKKEF